MNYKKKRDHQAFIDEIHAVEAKHGLRLIVMQAEPQISIQEMPKEQPTN